MVLRTDISPPCRTRAVKCEKKKGMENLPADQKKTRSESVAAQTGKDVNRDVEAATNEAGFRFSRRNLLALTGRLKTVGQKSCCALDRVTLGLQQVDVWVVSCSHAGRITYCFINESVCAALFVSQTQKQPLYLLTGSLHESPEQRGEHL